MNARIKWWTLFGLFVIGASATIGCVLAAIAHQWAPAASMGISAVAIAFSFLTVAGWRE